VCAASDQCHDAGVCDAGTGACSNPAKADGSACSDGNACTQVDACQSGACLGASPVICAASDQCHDAGVCDTGTGACSNPAKADGSACSDGNPCTQLDTCQSGACLGASPVVCAASDQCHDPGVCDSGTGACSNPAKADGAACSDGNVCTDADTCQAGSCVAGAAVPGPGGTTGLSFSAPTDLSWDPASGATGYDVIRGTLSVLAGGGFATATDACVGRVSDPLASDSHVPAEGDADWFLIRAVNACGTGTYDDGTASQVASREAGIAASSNTCP
jgi:hypothetical protein